jgi:hypothetical protein
MWEEHKLGVFEDRFLMEVFGHRGMKEQKLEKTV